MLVSLPMYLHDREAVVRLWRHLRLELQGQGLRDLPEQLTWPSDYHAHWLQPDLLLSQACGYPFIDDLDGHVQLVGCLRYAVPGASGVHCRSQVLVRADDAGHSLADFRGKRLAYNAPNSQSGYNSLRALVAPLAQGGRFFGSALATGAHTLSVAAVREGQADIAAIDCVTLAGLQRHAPDSLLGLHTLCETDPYPGLPLITAGRTSPATLLALQQGWTQVFERADTRSTRAALFMDGFEVHSAPLYDRCRQMRDTAATLGCTTL